MAKIRKEEELNQVSMNIQNKMMVLRESSEAARRMVEIGLKFKNPSKEMQQLMITARDWLADLAVKYKAVEKIVGL